MFSHPENSTDHSHTSVNFEIQSKKVHKVTRSVRYLSVKSSLSETEYHAVKVVAVLVRVCGSCARGLFGQKYVAALPNLDQRENFGGNARLCAGQFRHSSRGRGDQAPRLPPATCPPVARKA
ncbi:hypothetical protein CANARDRAFT_21226 [[Candida] arabinofermentans NRRL YB-2248]|uniref:Uncharacterized protein n=1 Tax=[Candida] arabinofermentans NRRL YB-2248 TaxID=983967 RepID=A0A1E4T6B3_9ASCO|nr:hypothetical protein CANARDRAFT_21226 [[Candida] arabinofermentans NRRL YB-2248]